MPSPQIVHREAWLKARKALLAEEKRLDHARDRLTDMRQALPAVVVEMPYAFESSSGTVSLRDLFAGHQQLIVYHFMFEPTRTTGCKHCSCVMDNLESALAHLGGRDTSFAAISRAPIQKIMAFKQRMHWTFPWVSSFDSDFNYDFQVTLDPERGSTTYNYRRLDHRGEMPGLSAFLIDADRVLHTY